MRFSTFLGAGFFVSLLLVATASIHADVRQGSEVVVEKDEVIDDDLYIFAQRITVHGTIKGDLIAFGQQIEIDGIVEGDLITAGQLVSLNGTVSDDVRVAGQVITLKGSTDIDDDLIAAGYSLECATASRVGGEVKFAGYQSKLAGQIEKDVNVASANCELSGNFDGHIFAMVESNEFSSTPTWDSDFPSVPPGLTVTDTANIAGDLKYRATLAATIDPASNITGEVQHLQLDSDAEQPPTIAQQAKSFAKQIFAFLVVGILVVYLCPKWTKDVANNIGHRPLASLGWGVVSLVAVIIGTTLLLVVIIAIAILLGLLSLESLIMAWLGIGALAAATLVIGYLIFSTWVAKVIVSVWAGNRIINGPDWVSRQRFVVLIVGILIFVALSWLPAVGSVISLVVTLMGIGSTAIWMFTKAGSNGMGKPVAIGKPVA
ncbi:MAG: polymer-forming cytoskeletal protein [Planctomycetota bacterium]